MATKKPLTAPMTSPSPNPGGKIGEDREARRRDVDERKRGDDARVGDRHADRQIETGGQQDDGLAEREDRQITGLCRDVPEIAVVSTSGATMPNPNSTTKAGIAVSNGAQG